MIPLAVWDILVAEQPCSEDWHIDIQSGSCSHLKGEDYNYGWDPLHHWVVCMDSVYSQASV
jgi:hypothetical protein